MTAFSRRFRHALRLAAVASAALAVTACTSIPAPKMGPGPPPMMTPKSAQSLGPAPVRGAAASFAFATLTGVPGDMRFSMEASLKRYAATRGIKLLPPGDASAVYQVKGYLSALGDNSGTLLVYTWDIYDGRGLPLYRISGQETADGSNSDPWTGIADKEIDAAARETIDRLADWVRG
jgi:hypothetical protein